MKITWRKCTMKMSKYLVALGLLIVSAAFSFSTIEDDVSYYIYDDKWEHGVPSGFMGEKDGKSLVLDDACKDAPYKGESCLKMIVKPGIESWRGLHIQFTGTWNVTLDENTKLPDLSEYNKLEFYAKAIPAPDKDVYLIQEIGVGTGDKIDSDAKFTDGYIEIGKEWKKYSIQLKVGELKKINTLLFFTLPEGTIYMDEIKFVKKKK